ncbi:hypothetical protein K450DRAFT_229128 [Umbelopsis ramanniana AG]|uniref:Glucosamine 6-phosphate N-acetyltransferase n=1 Tax=Umbelopsis ramanniana AG TaxID=1314678 RepID=A0AAD5EF95_UMBRA|nr:uncharacterized protein K450DRAFT_229128 [Umbelopsis ramanniana AG]KAI8582124.1 hypothetical protein K450DRAFT_229128 [Umbelopsis ramanniana AG]
MTIASEEPLFSTRLISSDVQEKLPQGVFLRPLQRSDYDRGILEVLSQLSVTGDITREKFEERFDFLKSTKTYFTTVVEDEKSGLIVACATLLAEYKFLHECGKIGHIEDVVVHDSQRGKKLGQRLIEQLQYVGRAIGCYKVILNCTVENVPFYEKCNLKKKDVQMTHYFEPFMIKVEEEINQQNYAKYQQRQATLDLGLSPNAEKSFRTMLLEAEQRLQSSSIRQSPTVSTKLTADPGEIKEDA